MFRRGARSIRRAKDEAAEAVSLGNLPRALQLYRALVEADPGDVQLLVRLGDVQKRLGRHAQAVSSYAAAAERFARIGLHLRAMAVCKLILEIDPAHAPTQARLAELHARRLSAPPGTPFSFTPGPGSGYSPGPRGVFTPGPRLGATTTPGPFATSRTPAPAEQAPTASAVQRPSLDLDFELEAPPPPAARPAARTVPEPGRSRGPEPVGPPPVLVSEPAFVRNLPVPEAERSRPNWETVRAEGKPGLEDLLLDVEVDEADGDQPVAQNLPDSLPPIPLFSDLERGAFLRLLETCRMRRLQAGEVAVRQGAPGDSFFVVASGRLEVIRRDASGADLNLAVLQEGSFFGEVALLTGASRTASVRAVEESDLLEFTADTLRSLVAEHPSVAVALRRFYRQRLLANVMATSALFRPLPREERARLMEKFRSREMAPGEALVCEGMPVDGLFVVLSGLVAVTRGGVPVAQLREGDLFGEHGLLTGENATATCRARTRGMVLRLPVEEFPKLAATRPELKALFTSLDATRRKSNEALLARRRIAADDDSMLA